MDSLLCGLARSAQTGLGKRRIEPARGLPLRPHGLLAGGVGVSHVAATGLGHYRRGANNEGSDKQGGVHQQPQRKRARHMGSLEASDAMSTITGDREFVFF